MKLQALLACIWWSLSSDTVAAAHLLWAFAPDWANGCVTSLANHYRNISCGEKYFLRRKIYFLRKKYISCGKNIFLAEKNISCGKKYFLQKKIYFLRKNIFLAEKIYFLRKKIYFLRRKIFLAEKNISCGKKYISCGEKFISCGKIYFLRRKIYFLRRKIFLAEKKIFLAEKYFLYHVTNKLPYWTHTRGLRFFFTMTSHERESVSNHQPLDCLFNANTKESIKVQRYWSFLWESTGGFHSQRVSDAEKNFPYDYVIIKFSAVNFAHIHHACFLWNRSCYCSKTTQIGKFMGPTWGPPGSCWPQLGPMLAPWTLLSGQWSNPKIYG